MTKLIPPDKTRCQVVERVHAPFAFGPTRWTQCESKPIALLVEDRDPPGSMSICSKHLKIHRELARSHPEWAPVTVTILEESVGLEFKHDGVGWFWKVHVDEGWRGPYIGRAGAEADAKDYLEELLR